MHEGWWDSMIQSSALGCFSTSISCQLTVIYLIVQKEQNYNHEDLIKSVQIQFTIEINYL